MFHSTFPTFTPIVASGMLISSSFWIPQKPCGKLTPTVQAETKRELGSNSQYLQRVDLSIHEIEPLTIINCWVETEPQIEAQLPVDKRTTQPALGPEISVRGGSGVARSWFMLHAGGSIANPLADWRSDPTRAVPNLALPTLKESKEKQLQMI